MTECAIVVLHFDGLLLGCECKVRGVSSAIVALVVYQSASSGRTDPITLAGEIHGRIE